MASTKETKPRSEYGDVVERLQAIVEALERGDLSLEDSLDRFGEGVALVKKGEALLADAEKRVEQLLSEDGRTAALKVPEEPQARGAAGASPAPPKPARRPGPASADDDVPF